MGERSSSSSSILGIGYLSTVRAPYLLVEGHAVNDIHWPPTPFCPLSGVACLNVSLLGGEERGGGGAGDMMGLMRGESIQMCCFSYINWSSFSSYYWHPSLYWCGDRYAFKRQISWACLKRNFYEIKLSSSTSSSFWSIGWFTIKYLCLLCVFGWSVSSSPLAACQPTPIASSVAPWRISFLHFLDPAAG